MFLSLFDNILNLGGLVVFFRSRDLRLKLEQERE